jgi:hypothetical protein
MEKNLAIDLAAKMALPLDVLMNFPMSELFFEVLGSLRPRIPQRKALRDQLLSDLGANRGQCITFDTITGDFVSVKNGKGNLDLLQKKILVVGKKFAISWQTIRLLNNKKFREFNTTGKTMERKNGVERQNFQA